MTLRNALALPLLVALAAFLGEWPLAAQTPVRVADLNTTRYDSGDSFFFASEFVESGGTVYFTASDVLYGLELWKTDGTAAGTVRITDLCPGACDSLPRNLTVVGSSIFFSADDGVHGTELWITDGITFIRMVADAVPGLGGSFPNFLRALGGRVVYSAADPTAGQELWISDGSVAGTQRIADLFPGPESSQAAPWLAFGAEVLFSANDGTHGTELWATDGSVAGTRRVRDIFPGVDSGLPGFSPVPGFPFFAVLGTRLYFAANEGTNGYELWATDGSEAGTLRVADLDLGASSSFPRDFAPFGAKLYFRASDGGHGSELWSTDGTEPGTTRVADIAPGSDSSSPHELTVFAGALYFAAADPGQGRELWKTDGTELGTVRVLDIRPGPDSGLELFTSPHGLTPIGGKLLFFADDGVHGNELWATDGTAAGTALLVDLNLGADGADFGSIAGGREVRLVSGGRWYFRAFDGPFAEGRQLFTSDGTAAGTARLKRLVEQRSGVALPSFGRSLEPGSTAAAGARLIYAGDDGTTGAEPAASTGTVLGTGILADLRPGFDTSGPGDMFSFDASVLFRAQVDQGGDLSLWVTDGTPGGTTQLPAIPGQPASFTRFDQKAFFAAADTAHGVELWRTDGTPGGTALFSDLVPGSPSGSPGEMAVLNGRLFFTATDPAAGRELWSTEGTAAGRFRDILPGTAESFPTQLTAMPTSVFSNTRRLFFTADDGTAGRELWTTDGTFLGTRPVADIRSGPASSMSAFPVESFGVATSNTIETFAFTPKVLFAADDGVAGEEIWISDGSENPGGTQRFHDIYTGPASSEPRQLTRIGDKIAFVAESGFGGREVWIADGEGSLISPEPRIGQVSSVPQYLTGFGTLALFSADDGVHGREPWITDGTYEGTRLLANLAPGPLPSSPYAFTAAGNDIYFAATDGTSGFELWRLPRAGLGARLAATKSVTGQFVPSGFITYTIVIRNHGLARQPRSNEVVMQDPISDHLGVVSLAATSGGVVQVIQGGHASVVWFGEIRASGEVTITIQARVLPGTPPGTVITNQAVVHYDSDGNLANDSDALSDDPNDGTGRGDPTAFRVGLGYYTLEPCRVLDSRAGAPLVDGALRTFVLAGVCGIPATAKAAALNLTAISPTDDGFLTLWPSGESQPLATSLNFRTGQTRTNNAILALGAAGAIDARPGIAGAPDSGSVHLVIDVVGWFE